MIRDVTPQTAYFDNNYIKKLIKISKTAKLRSLSHKRPIKRSKVEANMVNRDPNVISKTHNDSTKKKIKARRVPKINLRSKSLAIVKKFKQGIKWKKIRNKLKTYKILTYDY